MPTTLAFQRHIDIVVIGDNEMLLRDLAPLFSPNRYRLVTARTAALALSIVANRAAAAVLINVTMLGTDAYNICTELRAKSLLPIIMISADKQLEELVASIEAGADYYMVMPFAIQELEARIQAIHRRITMDYIPQFCITQGNILLNPIKQEVRINEMVVDLTTNECRLLQYLVRNPNRAIRTEQLLKLVWGYDSKDDLSVVRITVHRLRNKIEKNPASPKYLKTIFGVGYRFCINADC